MQETGPDSRIFSYIHLGGKIGVLLKLSAAQAAALDHPRVQELGKDLCMQVAAAAPIALSRGEIPKEKVESESVIYRELALKEGKPEKILDKIVAGRLDKFYKETVLLEQPFVKDPERSVSQVVSGAAKEAGSDLKVVSFLRYQLGVEP